MGETLNVWRVLLTLLGLAALGTITTSGAAEKFHRMQAAEIRSVLIGKFITDESHWADHYLADGRMGGHQLGQAQTGTWTLSKSGEVCTVTKTKTKPSETSCFEVWLSGDQVQYRNGDILLSEGVLRNE